MWRNATRTTWAKSAARRHHLLHTKYHSRRRISDEDLDLVSGTAESKLVVSVCVGTSCYVRGSQNLLHGLIRHVEEQNLQNVVDIKATFCFERCNKGPNVAIGDVVLEKCTFEKACEVLGQKLDEMKQKS